MRKYQPKLIFDRATGEPILNPKYKPDTRKRHGDRHNGKQPSGTHRRRDTFIAIDGEGVTFENGQHEYILLTASTGEYVVNEQGLSTVECFEFLLSLAKRYKHGIFVCFSASYDVNMMLRDVEHKKLKELWAERTPNKPYSIYFGEPGAYEFAAGYRPRKHFSFGKIANREWDEEKNKPKNVYEASLTLWDVFGFFQKSFTETLEEWFSDYLCDGIITFPGGQAVDLNHIKAMKKARSTFTTAQLEEIKLYCMQECVALAHLMERLQEYLHIVGVSLSRWDGAGAIASSLLESKGVKDHVTQGPGIQAHLNKPVHDVCLRAYAGGRFEEGYNGVYLGKMWNYDVRSAYPSVMPELPSMKNGMWRLVKGMSNHKYSLMHVRWRFDDMLPYYPFFFRDDQGSIYFPSTGEGWYHRSEVDAALRAHAQGKLSTERDAGSIDILETWEFHQYEQTKPFAFVTDLYEQRRRWKAEEPPNPAEKVLKTAINSFYGKTAQSLGGTAEKPPPFHNIYWAGYITAAIRAKIFDAIMLASKPESVVLIATDGIYSTVPLDLPLGESLGQWEVHPIDGVVVVQAGIYWGLKKLDQEPSHEGLTEKEFKYRYWQHEGEWYSANAHYRGFDRGTLTVERVMYGWERHLYSLSIPTPERFVTLGSVLGLNGAAPEYDEQWQYWRTWRTVERKIWLTPQAKRIARTLNEEPHKHLCLTWAAPPQATLSQVNLSYPYKLKWIGEDDESYGYIDGVDKDIVLGEIDEVEMM